MKTQARKRTCDETVREYAELIESGERFPPITVFFDVENDVYVLADGFHRLLAHLRAKPNDPIICDQYLGSVKDALRYAVSANKSHGLKRTNEDKRNAVEIYFLELEGGEQSDRQVADFVGVSFALAASVRKQLIREERLQESCSRVGKDGRTYNTANIGPKAVTEYVCGGCGHYKSPRCLIEGAIKPPTDPACDEFTPRCDEESTVVEDEEPEIADPGEDDEYVPKEVRHRVGRRKRGAALLFLLFGRQCGRRLIRRI